MDSTSSDSSSLSVFGESLKLFRASAPYLLSVSVMQLAGFMLVPIYTRRIAPSHFGGYETLLSITGIISEIAAFGLSTVLVADLQKYSNGERQKFIERVVAQYLFLGTPLWLLCLVPFLVPGISLTLFSLSPLVVAIHFAGQYLLFFVSLFLAFCKVQPKPGSYVLTMLLQALFYFSFALVLIVAMDYDIEGLVIANAIGAAAGFLVAGHFLMRTGNPLSRQAFTSGLPYFRAGLKVLPATVASWAIWWGNRFFVLIFAGPEEVGKLGVAMRFAGLYETLLVLPVLAGLTHKVYAGLADGSWRGIARGPIALIFASFLALAFLLSLAVRYSVGESYQDASLTVILLAGPYFLKGVIDFLCMYLYFYRGTWQVSRLYLQGAVISTASGLLFIATLGTAGVAASLGITIASLVVLAVLNIRALGAPIIRTDW